MLVRLKRLALLAPQAKSAGKDIVHTMSMEWHGAPSRTRAEAISSALAHAARRPTAPEDQATCNVAGLRHARICTSVGATAAPALPLVRHMSPHTFFPLRPRPTTSPARSVPCRETRHDGLPSDCHVGKPRGKYDERTRKRRQHSNSLAALRLTKKRHDRQPPRTSALPKTTGHGHLLESPPRSSRPVLFRVGWRYVFPRIVLPVRDGLRGSNHDQRFALGGLPHPTLHLHKGRRVGSGFSSGSANGSAWRGRRQRRQGGFRHRRAVRQVKKGGCRGERCRPRVIPTATQGPWNPEVVSFPCLGNNASAPEATAKVRKNGTPSSCLPAGRRGTGQPPGSGAPSPNPRRREKGALRRGER